MTTETKLAMMHIESNATQKGVKIKMAKEKAKVEFSVFHIVPKTEIPQRAYPNAIESTQLPADMQKLAEHIKREGVTPYEGAAEINIKQLGLKGRDGKPLRNPKLTLTMWLRAFIKKQGLDKHVVMVTRGERVFLEGK